MISLLAASLLSMNVASADIVVRVTPPWWNRRHRHYSHCSHRPPANPNGQWVFVPGHWERRGPHKSVWVHGHWKIAPPPARPIDRHYRRYIERRARNR